MSPRKLNETEKNHTKELFYTKGKDLLLSLGVKKTTVEDITKMAGMSKGSFYLYFDSKEEFFFDIFEIHERQLEEKATELLALHTEIPMRQKLIIFLREILLSEENTLFFLKNDDLHHLMHKIPPERLSKHLDEDNDLIVKLMKQAQINTEKCNPYVVSNLVKVLFLTRSEVDLLNKEVIAETLEVIIDTMMNYIFGKE